MSGGHFDYQQYYIGGIADNIENILNRQGKERPKEDLYMHKEYYEEYPEEKLYYTYPEIIQNKLKEAIKQLRIAEIYAQRVDWLLSGDDGQESFIRRLEEDLNNLQITK